MLRNMSCVGLAVSENTLLADRDLAEIEADAQKKLGIRHGGRNRWMATLEVRFGECGGTAAPARSGLGLKVVRRGGVQFPRA